MTSNPYAQIIVSDRAFATETVVEGIAAGWHFGMGALEGGRALNAVASPLVAIQAAVSPSPQPS